ncbi:MAG: DM13 domain-containing protein [bacterium]
MLHSHRRPLRHRCRLIAATLGVGALLCAAALTTAAQEVALDAAAQEIARGEWTNKGYDIHGAWRIVARDDGVRYIVFDDDFKTRSGPDLKVFLSPRALSEINDRTAAPDSVEIGALQAHAGAQEYAIPADLDLAEYRSLLIHCKAFSHLWGGAEIHAAP